MFNKVEEARKRAQFYEERAETAGDAAKRKSFERLRDSCLRVAARNDSSLPRTDAPNIQPD